MKKRTKKTLILFACSIVLNIGGVIGTALLSPTNHGLFVTCIKIIKQNITSLYGIVSLTLPAIDFFLVIATGKEPPKDRDYRFLILLFTLVFLYQCACIAFPDNVSAIGAWSLIATASLFYIYLLISERCKASHAASIQSSRKATVLELSSLAKRKIRTAHNDITSIQIYDIKKTSLEGSIVYNVEYIDSALKNAENLNASLNVQLSIDLYDWECFATFQEFYNKCLSETEPELKKSLLEVLYKTANDSIAQMKSVLVSRIRSVADITCKDACTSRLILIYLSCLAKAENDTEDCMAGIRCQSLNIAATNSKSAEINQQLFSKYHTGFLGALLLKEPYIFYYEGDQNSAKANRRYVSFQLENENAEKAFLVLITLKGSNDSDNISHHLLKNLKSIQNDFIKYYMKYEVARNEKAQE